MGIVAVWYIFINEWRSRWCCLAFSSCQGEPFHSRLGIFGPWCFLFRFPPRISPPVILCMPWLGSWKGTMERWWFNSWHIRFAPIVSPRLLKCVFSIVAWSTNMKTSLKGPRPWLLHLSVTLLILQCPTLRVGLQKNQPSPWTTAPSANRDGAKRNNSCCCYSEIISWQARTNIVLEGRNLLIAWVQWTLLTQ